MTPIEDFKKILKEQGCNVPSESLEVFRDLIDAQANFILDQYLEEKFSGESHNDDV